MKDGRMFLCLFLLYGTVRSSYLDPYHCIYLGNVLKELSEPAGAVIYCSRFKVNTEEDVFCSFSFYLVALFLSTVFLF